MPSNATKILPILLSAKKIMQNHATIEHILNPDVYRSYFFIVLIALMALCVFLTLQYGNVDWKDNLLYNTFGMNSYCLYLDYPPAIYFGPAGYGICLVLIVPYVLGMFVRIHLHYLEGEVSECAHRMCQILSVLEICSFIVFGTVFAVNDEHITLHIMCYVQMIFTLMLGGLRNLWYAKHFAPDLPQWKLVLGYIYVILFEGFGFVIGANMTSIVLFEHAFIGVVGSGFVDKMFSVLWFLQVIIGYCVHNSYPDLKFTIGLDRKEDGVKNVMSAVSALGKKAETEILMTK